jgi:hypothetical protein
VELPQDPAEDLAVVAPGLAAPAIGGRERLHEGEGLVGELEHPPPPGWWISRSVTLSSRSATSSKVRLQY